MIEDKCSKGIRKEDIYSIIVSKGNLDMVPLSVLRETLKELVSKIDVVIKEGVVCDLPHSDFFLMGHEHALKGVKEELDLMFGLVLSSGDERPDEVSR